MKIDDAGPAFPSEIAPFNPGMSLRDWFAGQALTNVVFSPWSRTDMGEAANSCYQMADAMIAQRGKE